MPQISSWADYNATCSSGSGPRLLLMITLCQLVNVHIYPIACRPRKGLKLLSKTVADFKFFLFANMTIMATEFLVFVVAYFVFFSGSCHSAILRTRAGGPEWTFDATAVQWAPNCKDPSPSNPREMKIYTVLRAFDGALELIADAMDRITETHATLSVDEGPSIAQKLQVSEADPAYVQFFKNDYGKERIDRVKDMFEHMHDITANLGEGHRPAGRDGQIKISCSNSWENCVQGSFAFTTPQDEKRESYRSVCL